MSLDPEKVIHHTDPGTLGEMMCGEGIGWSADDWQDVNCRGCLRERDRRVLEPLTQSDWDLIRDAALTWAKQVEGAMPGPEPLLGAVKDLLIRHAPEDGPSGLYVDDDDEREEAEQEERFQTSVRTTLTCYPCVFRVMSADTREIVRIGNEHKDCTFEKPLLPRDKMPDRSYLIELVTDAICSVPPNEERAPGRDGPRRVARSIVDALIEGKVVPGA